MKNRYLISILLLLTTMFLLGMGETPKANRNKQHLVLEEPIASGDSNVSMVVSFPGEIYEWNVEDIKRTIKTVKKAGLKINQLYYTWGEIEKKKNSYDWGELDFNFQLLSDNGIKASLVIKLIDTNHIGDLPKGIRFKSFGSKDFQKQFRRFVLDLLKRYQGKIDYIWIGNEIDGYFYEKREEFKDYSRLFNNTYNAVKKKYPNVKVGTIFTYHDSKNNNALDLVEKICKSCDIIGFSLYPQIIKGAKVTDTGKFFDDMKAVAGKVNKKFAITETGWSADGFGGSEDKQSQFIKELFGAYKKHKSNVEFLGLFLLYDFPSSINNALADSYGLKGHREFVKFQGSLGLAHNDGRPRAAWSTLQEEMKKFK